ncbi:outer membrane biogenesis protein BamB [Anatilimnocola aggregata]|uniref:Outer membrane biogenesis protein BamB n=1 Tax=Anatilimnocola aggregata TaxID=2528021 RepID=A0A517YML0_9BACT|nr:PQQ-binding-like beta-propeller repeat protein [Anatilimnocola aggregata]QDU31441.1 outer membrane biogenesis protein BamB [Anatilimnocola aggregata]
MLPTLCVLLSLCTAESQPAWPAFLGQGASEVKPDSLPVTWSPAANIAWQTDLAGFGQSSPVIYGERVFVTAVEGPDKDICHLLALNLSDGKVQWKHSFDSSDKVKNSLYVSRAAPTPVTDDKHVFAFFESGDVVAVTHTGTEKWRKSLSSEFGKFQNKFGLAASPVMTDDSIVILVDDEGPSYLIALSKTDGKTKWKTDRTSRTSWSSPSLVEVAGAQHVVCSSSGTVDGYEAATGKLLWSYDEVGGNNKSTPRPYAPGSFLVGASASREAKATPGTDPKKSNFAMTIELVDGKPQPKVLWRTEQATPTFNSPVVYAGHAYWVNTQGVVFCLDATTGEARYTERLKQSCWATPLGVGDRLYFFGKDGVTSVLRTGPKFELLAENQLWDPAQLKVDPAKGAAEDTEEKREAAAMFSGPTQYGVAAVSGSLLIRTGDKLYCLRTNP